MFDQLLPQRIDVMPIARIGAPPGFFINLALVALMIVGLVVSLRNHGDSQASA